MAYLKTGIYSDEHFQEILEAAVGRMDNMPDDLVKWLDNNIDQELVTADVAEGALIEAVSLSLSIQGTLIEEIMEGTISWHVTGWVLLLGLRLGLIKIELPGRSTEKKGENNG